MRYSARKISRNSVELATVASLDSTKREGRSQAITPLYSPPRARYLTPVRTSGPQGARRTRPDQLHTLQTILLVAPILLFSMIAHEIAHGYAALRQGDRTALEAGRLSWN